jgi:hypothetical protein
MSNISTIQQHLQLSKMADPFGTIGVIGVQFGLDWKMCQTMPRASEQSFKP